MFTFSNENEYCEDLLPAFSHNSGIATQLTMHKSMTDPP